MNIDLIITMCTSLIMEMYVQLGLTNKVVDNNGHVVFNMSKHSRVKTVLGKLRNTIFQGYRRFFPNCVHSSNHVSHGLFSKYVDDRNFIKKFLENRSVLIFVSPKEDRPMGLALISRSILKAKDLAKADYKVDRESLTAAGITFHDIEWSTNKILSGKYLVSGKKKKTFRRVYK